MCRDFFNFGLLGGGGKHLPSLPTSLLEDSQKIDFLNAQKIENIDHFKNGQK
jgi:hypothetical protein